MSGGEWKKYRLGEIANPNWGFVDGPFGSNLPASDYTPSGVPVIRGVNLSLGDVRFKDEGFIFVSEKTAKRLERSKCLRGDIIFTKKGTLGQIGIIPDDSRFEEYILSSNQMKLTVNPIIADKHFVYYYLASKTSIEKIRRDSEHTGVPKINLTYLKRFPIALPDLHTQHQIATILSSLDDKIELNRQMNQTLEAMAQALFQEWFVDFRFPGATGELVESELGMIPKGWRVGTLGELGVFKNGINYSREESGDTEYSIINVRDVVDNKFLSKSTLSRIHTDAKKAKPYLLESDDIVVVRSASPGETAIMLNNEEGVIYSGFTIRYRLTNKAHFLYCFFILQNVKNQLDNLSNGTTLKNVNQEILKGYRIVVPSIEIISQFNRVVQSVIEKILSLQQENQSLTQLRDELLPALMQGRAN